MIFHLMVYSFVLYCTVLHRNPFEITEQFITKYNLSYGSDEQEKYVELAKQLLIRSQVG